MSSAAPGNASWIWQPGGVRTSAAVAYAAIIGISDGTVPGRTHPWGTRLSDHSGASRQSNCR